MREALNEVAWQQEEALGVALEWRQATCGKVGGDLVPLPWRKAFGAALSDAPGAQEQINVLEPLTGDTCGEPGFTDRALVFDDGIIDRHGSLHFELRLQASHARVQCFMHPPRLHPGVVFNFAPMGETGAWAIAQDMIKLEFRE